MDFSRKLLSTLTGGQTPAAERGAEDAKAFSDESLSALRLSISNPNISTSAMKENMLRLIYGEMMGQDVQFGVIYALKLAQSGQTDLTSSNFHYVVVALVTLCNMTLKDVVPSMVGHVLSALSHTHESVRKRALIALKNFYMRDADLIAPYLDQIKKSLYDSEPSVMSAALGLFAVVVHQHHASQMKDLVPVLVKILQQVVDGRLPKGYSYHGTAAPWIQIRCLQIMAQLGQQDLSASRSMTPAIMGAFHKARQGVDAAFAVLFEIIRTLNTFHPAIILELCQFVDVAQNPLLIIPKFATSSNQNLKYLGISMLCQVQPSAWSDTWWSQDLLAAVVQALESRDATVQRRALDLLYRMLTADNSENIIDRLVYAFFQEQDVSADHYRYLQEGDGQEHSLPLDRISSPSSSSTSSPLSLSGTTTTTTTTTEGHVPTRKEKILGQILDAAERFGRSEEWYLDLIFDLLERGGRVVTMQTAEKVMRVFERGARSTAFNTTHLRVLAVQKTMHLLAQREYLFSCSRDTGSSQPTLAYVTLWLLGEYGDDADDWKLSTVMETLARCLLINHDPLIQTFILSALTKAALRSAPNGVPKNVTGVVRAYLLDHPVSCTLSARVQSRQPYPSSVDIQLRAHEFLMIAELAS
ncbi:hypothetical protein BGZ99_006338 [Dissophora globulifera]|uniref:Clathrin/coatomer adaptor adaptin-like N-terminal domain-containing protein n=1 Tax=Dissophora globulifera TaxID=979702 RepID=A0A9P6RFA4_9FUNG|nr:hypothetical protein BGZ99_006338 [Dissophora globulifera]